MTEKNAANAEKSASVSEELQAKAEEMREGTSTGDLCGRQRESRREQGLDHKRQLQLRQEKTRSGVLSGRRK
ncbi:MAG: hypothetical protein KAV87_31975 [Desulfobacteraceae bacterium]|nr:hypothetical protein [Desulfobacteraceae bacterium]